MPRNDEVDRLRKMVDRLEQENVVRNGEDTARPFEHLVRQIDRVAFAEQLCRRPDKGAAAYPDLGANELRGPPLGRGLPQKKVESGAMRTDLLLQRGMGVALIRINRGEVTRLHFP